MPNPERVPPRRSPLRPLSALLWLAASILTLLATSIELLSTTFNGSGSRMTAVRTSGTAISEGP